MSTIKRMGRWVFEEHADDRIQVTREGRPGWIEINATSEGFIIDLWPDVGNESIGSTHALYTELEASE